MYNMPTWSARIGGLKGLFPLLHDSNLQYYDSVLLKIFGLGNLTLNLKNKIIVLKLHCPIIVLKLHFISQDQRRFANGHMTCMIRNPQIVNQCIHISPTVDVQSQEVFNCESRHKVLE